jgi:hypothetical protein
MMFALLNRKEQVMTKGIWSLLVVGALGLAGCASEEGATQSAGRGETNAYLVAAEPAGAASVGDARKSTKDDDEVVLVGRIGGSAEPFVDGMAAFTIVDLKVPHCSAEEGCPTPWDYCCEQDQVKENIATVKVVDKQGKPVSQDARQLLGVKELATVVVHGQAQRDGEGNLSVLADQVFLKE